MFINNKTLIKTTMQATVKITRGGQVSIPYEIREAMGLKPGDLIIVDIVRKIIPEAEQGNAEAEALVLPIHA